MRKKPLLRARKKPGPLIKQELAMTSGTSTHVATKHQLDCICCNAVGAVLQILSGHFQISAALGEFFIAR